MLQFQERQRLPPFTSEEEVIAVSELKHPLQAILIAPDQTMRENILSGEKEITIREGHRDYRPGPAMICCHLELWAVQVDIVDVRHTTMDCLRINECHADGFIDKLHALECMREYYPNLTWDSPITVIRWENARGKLVDAYHAQRQSLRRSRH